MKKATKKAAKKAVKKVAAKKAAVKKVVAKKAVKKVAAKKAVKKAVAKKAVKKTTSSATPKTAIIVDTNVGFGNTLYLRGEAPGLSWSKGVPMDCQSTETWSITMAGVKQPFEYKVLINDTQWSVGSNFQAKPSVSNEIAPSF